MYYSFYQLSENPFALTPDPRYLRMNKPYQKALAALREGVQEQKGFALLVGEVGTGKTTLIHHFLGSCGQDVKTAFIFHPAHSFEDLLQMTLQDLEVSCQSRQRLKLLEALHVYLLQVASAGQTVVLIIDEAQRLSAEVLEELRMLSNLETSRHKLLQVVLVGQPELAEKLRHPELRQLQQRIAVAAELKPLSCPEAVHYITHRLQVAGYPGQRLFTCRALRKLHRASGGIPRLINVICDKSISIGERRQARQINGRIVNQALKERSILRQGNGALLHAAGASQAASRFRQPHASSSRKIAVMVGALLALALLFFPTAQGENILAQRLSRTLVKAEFLGKALWHNVSRIWQGLEATMPVGPRHVPQASQQEPATTDEPE
jgi:general secretion pathway protein A